MQLVPRDDWAVRHISIQYILFSISYASNLDESFYSKALWILERSLFLELYWKQISYLLCISFFKFFISIDEVIFINK